MEEALSVVNAGALVAAEETGEAVARFARSEEDAQRLDRAAARFAKLDKLSMNFKMGPIQQLVAVGDDSAELTVRRPEAKVVSIVSAPTLDRTYAAQEYVSELLKQ